MSLLERSLPLLMREHGTPGQVVVKLRGGEEFTVDAIVAMVRGAELFVDVGQTTRLLLTAVYIKRSVFEAKGVTSPPMMAAVDAHGLTNWAVNMNETVWGPQLVKLGLQRETLAREYQATRNATV